VPVLATRLGRPLARHGVAVINIGGVAFEPFVELFAEDRLLSRCVVISDADPPTAAADTDGDEPTGADGADGASDVAQPAAPALSARAAALLEREGGNVRVRLAQKTLEWDLATAGNWETMLQALETLKPIVAARLRGDGEAPPEERADQLLAKLGDVKGSFAQELADLLEAEPEAAFTIPAYLQEAIAWVTGE